MSKYNLTDEEKKLLKVAKYNQDTSTSISYDIQDLKASWSKTNQENAELLDTL